MAGNPASQAYSSSSTATLNPKPYIAGLLLLFYGYKCQGRFLCGEQEDLLVYGMMPGWRELVTVLACIQFLFAVSRQWWYVVERGIPRINRQIVDHARHPPSNRLL